MGGDNETKHQRNATGESSSLPSLLFISNTIDPFMHEIRLLSSPDFNAAFAGLDRTASSNDPPRLRPIPIVGDGRCLFRAVTHGAYWRSGKPSPNQSLQKCLADELRNKVADEFVQRRRETEWFLEGDFDHYVNQIRKPHVWGGEPELIMCSHVLRMPITVYMCTDGNKVPKIIAEYGQEYGKMGPICVLYHGYGHYDALQPPVVKNHKVF